MNHNPEERPAVSFQLIPDPNPWQDKAALPRPTRAVSLLLSLLTVAAAAYRPLSAPTWYTVLLLVGLAVLYLTAARAPVTVATAVGAFAVGALCGGLALGVGALAAVASIGLGAYLFCTLRSPYLVALPVASFIASLLLCGEIPAACLALLPYAAAILMARATMKNSHRVEVICASSVGLCLGGAMLAALALTAVYGSPSPLPFINEWEEALRTELHEVISTDEALAQTVEQAFSQLGFTLTEFIDSTLDLLIMLLPALILTVANYISFAAQHLLVHTMAGTGLTTLVTRSARLFIMSVPSALIFLVCSLISVFASTASLAYAVAENLYAILLPGMCIAGLYKLVADLRVKRGGWLAVILVISAFCAPSACLMILSISGAITTLLRPLVVRMIFKGPPSEPPSA